jgi:transposase
MLEHPDGIDVELQASLGLCERLMTMLEEELQHIDATLANRTRGNEIIERLQTIPGIGPVASHVLYATIG